METRYLGGSRTEDRWVGTSAEDQPRCTHVRKMEARQMVDKSAISTSVVGVLNRGINNGSTPDDLRNSQLNEDGRQIK